MFGTLYARQVFAVPGLGPNIYNIGIITGAVALSQFFTPGIKGMAWGALFGAVLGNLVIPFGVMRRMGSRFRPSFDVRHPGVKKVFVLMLPVILGLSLPGVYDMITRYFGTFYTEGVNSSLRYANVLMQAPLGVFGQSLAIAVFPALSQFYAQGRMDMVRSQLNSTLRTVLYLTIPVSAFMFVGAQPVVAAIYQHGKFTAEDTRHVTELLRWFSVGIWAWCLHPVLMRGFFALQKSKTPIILGTVTTFVFVGLILLLRPAMSYHALAAASSISAIFLAGMMLFAIQREVGTLDYRGLLETAIKSGIGTIAFAGATYVVLLVVGDRVDDFSKLVNVLLLFLVAVPGAWLYYFVTKALGMPETGFVSRAMEKVNRKIRPITPVETGDGS
jgi:putative peptidoglycan lipid II flippase